MFLLEMISTTKYLCPTISNIFSFAQITIQNFIFLQSLCELHLKEEINKCVFNAHPPPIK